MDDSILNNVKKNLGLAVEYEAFDPDVITHINAAFSILNQLGVGPRDGFMITNNDTAWPDYPIPLNQQLLVKTYVYLKVKVLFDPPATSFHLSAAQDQIKEYEWRLNCFREVALVTVPLPSNLNFYGSNDTFVASWGYTPKVEIINIFHRVVGTTAWVMLAVPNTTSYTGEQVIATHIDEGVQYEIYIQATAEGFEPVESEHTFIIGGAAPGPQPLDPPNNAAVTPVSGQMLISWDNTENVQFVLIFFKVVGDPDFDVNSWGIDQHAVAQDSDVDVDYEYYLVSTADGFEPGESDHFFVTGI